MELNFFQRCFSHRAAPSISPGQPSQYPCHQDGFPYPIRLPSRANAHVYPNAGHYFFVAVDIPGACTPDGPALGGRTWLHVGYRPGSTIGYSSRPGTRLDSCFNCVQGFLIQHGISHKYICADTPPTAPCVVSNTQEYYCDCNG